ncbi:MAG: type III pantothenate kinase [Cyanobacteria bacterium]|nr:type III pantothenate kinase [Cyanobacteriota bacterium]MDA1246036.1 type III pantothenate kinase [Cyanobacteriota bacterium]
MWHPSAGIYGRGHLSEGRWLLIGNSRWHWAAGEPGCLRTWTAPAGVGEFEGLVAWAGVGHVPNCAPLPLKLRLQLKDVPLLEQPGWLGVDRALVAWRAWCLAAGPVLVADGGTAMSLTLVTREGRFAGGRLLAGAALQLRALAAETAELPGLNLPVELPLDIWPRLTPEAMAAGVLRGLAAALASAGREAQTSCPGCGLWLTGGDGPLLKPLLLELLFGAMPLQLAPDLALEALAALRPGPDR